jgi:hypothetical protein
MNRSRTSLAIAVVAVAFLGACGGGDASQSDVQDKVEDLLTNEDDREQVYPGVPLETAEAAGAAACVAQGLFDPNNFSKDERNDVTSAIDSDVPGQQVIVRFEELVEECVDEATAVPTQGPNLDDDEDQDQQDTTTTERSTSTGD